MITAAFDLAIWTVLFFSLGMYKPKWPLFFLNNPDRFLIAIITTVLVMITFTLYGEGHRREQSAKEEIAKLAVPNPTPSNAVPVPDITTAKPISK